MKITDIKTEYRTAPIGIDIARPRFSWKIVSDKQNMMQTSYRILAYSDAECKQLIWDSSTVSSSDSQRVRWGGRELCSAERVYWKVIVTVTNGEVTEQAESDLSFFEMGLLDVSDWHCSWIELPDQSDWFKYQPAPIMRKEFTVKKGLKSARIYQTAHGLYEFWLNGRLGTDEKSNVAWL